MDAEKLMSIIKNERNIFGLFKKFAAKNDRKNMMKLYNKYKFSTFYLEAVFQMACCIGYTELVREIMFSSKINGICCSVNCEEGYMPFISFPNVMFLERLLQKDPLIRDPTNKHSRALVRAVYNNHADVVELLLYYPMIYITSSDMVFAMDASCHNDLCIRLACKNGYTEIVKLLLRNGVSPECCDNEPMRLACENNQEDIIRLLYNHDNGVVENIEYVYIAVRYDNKNIVKLLFQYLYSLNAYFRLQIKKCIDDFIEISNESGFDDMVEYLENFKKDNYESDIKFRNLIR